MRGILVCCLLVASLVIAAVSWTGPPTPAPSNAPPVSDAGPDLVAVVGEVVAFDGSESFDPDGGTGGFGPSVKVDDALEGSQTRPDIAVGPDGSIHVAWADGRNYAKEHRFSIYYAKSTDGGLTWSPNVQVDDSASGGRTLPHIAVGGDGVVHVAWTDMRNGEFDAYYARSTDGGLHFGPDVRMNDDGGIHWQEVPDIAVDPAGRVHSAWRDARNLNYMDVYYANSTGSGFGANLLVNDVPGAAFQSAMIAIAADSRGVPHVVWEDSRNTPVGNSREDVYYATLNGAGTGFAANVQVTDDLALPAGSVGNPSIAVGPGDTIYVSWMDLRDDSEPTDSEYRFNLYMAVSHDQGRTFGPNIRLVDSGRVYAPVIAVDAAGDVRAVWRDGRSYLLGDLGQLLYAEFAEDGTLLSGPVQVNDVMTTDHYEPSLALSAEEKPFVVWFENRTTGFAYDIYFAGPSAPSAADMIYRWDFGDRSTAEGVRVEHAFAAPGDYLVALTVTDAQGDSDVDTANIRVVEDPALILSELRQAVANLPDEVFKAAGNSPPHRRQALLNKVDAVASLVAAGAFAEALKKLQQDLNAKWDGCFGGHLASDWVVDCGAQRQLLLISARLAKSLEILADR